MWQVHLAEIDRQGREWRQLRGRHPGLPLVVAGDFNQDRDGSGWYGTAATRARLGEALDAAGLRCLTNVDAVSAGLLAQAHLVDHICATEDLRVEELRCLERHESGQKLSDHPTVVVDFAT